MLTRPSVVVTASRVVIARSVHRVVRGRPAPGTVGDPLSWDT